MKLIVLKLTAVILFPIAILPLPAYSQQIVPFPVADAHWCESGSWTDGSWVYEFNNRYSIRTDTIINSMNYQVISNYYVESRFLPTQPWINYCCDTIYEHSFAYLRSTNKQVYHFEPTLLQDFLIYDFNLSLNDTFYASWWGLSTMNKVTLLDSVSDGVQYRKRWWLTSLMNNPPTFSDSNYVYIIDGIGSSFGLFGLLIPPFESLTNLECYKENNGLMYSPSGLCNCLTLNVNLQDQSNLLIYPNPAENFVTVFHKNKPYELELYDASGRRMIKKDAFSKTTIDISNWEQGVYFIHILENNKLLKVSKFIKL